MFLTICERCRNKCDSDMCLLIMNQYVSGMSVCHYVCLRMCLYFRASGHQRIDIQVNPPKEVTRDRCRSLTLKSSRCGRAPLTRPYPPHALSCTSAIAMSADQPEVADASTQPGS